MDRRELEGLVALGLTQRQLAERLGCSHSTIRYWLRRWNLSTRQTNEIHTCRAARGQGQQELERECPRHGCTIFVLDRAGTFRCRRCRAEGVARRRRRVKEILVAEAGGSCALCGYDKHPGVLEFHHRDPSAKRFALAASGLTRGIDAMRQEAAKCVLLCSNCHAEVELGLALLAPAA